MKKFGLLFSILVFANQLFFAQVNIIPVSTDVAGFSDWIDLVVSWRYNLFTIVDRNLFHNLSKYEF